EVAEEGVVARTAEQGVVARAAVQGVVTSTTDQGVVARAAVQRRRDSHLDRDGVVEVAGVHDNSGDGERAPDLVCGEWGAREGGGRDVRHVRDDEVRPRLAHCDVVRVVELSVDVQRRPIHGHTGGRVGRAGDGQHRCHRERGDREEAYCLTFHLSPPFGVIRSRSGNFLCLGCRRHDRAAPPSDLVWVPYRAGSGSTGRRVTAFGWAVIGTRGPQTGAMTNAESVYRVSRGCDFSAHLPHSPKRNATGCLSGGQFPPRRYYAEPLPRRRSRNRGSELA